MGKHSAINNNNNSSNVLSQQKIMENLNQMTKNDLKPQFNNNKKDQKKSKKQQQKVQQPKEQPKDQPKEQPQEQPQPQQTKQNGKQRNKKQQAQQKIQQQQAQQQTEQKPKQQQAKKVKQPQQPPKPVKPDTSVRNTSRLLSAWEFYTNNDSKNTTDSNIEKIETFANRGDIRAQLDKIKEIEVKYQYKPENKPTKTESKKKLNNRRLREAIKAPPGVHAYRMKQFLQEMNSQRQQRATHERVTNLLVKRYTQRMNAFADEYQKAYKTYQESIKENLGVAVIKNSQANANKTFSHQKRLQKKEKLQKKLFRRQSKRILESHTSPAKWTPANEKLFQTAVQKILGQGYQGFNFYGRPEYNRELAWVEANENTTGKESISVATIMACQNSPIPGETRLSQNRVPTVAPTQQKKQPQQQLQKPKKQNVVKEKPMTIKTQTPEQYRERISGKKSKKTDKNGPDDNNGKKGGKSSNTQRKMEQKTSPSVVNPGPATWVTETEMPDSFAWGILQHQPNGNRSGGSKKGNKDETLNQLIPKSAPNQGNRGNNNKKQQNNRRPKGTNISDLL